MKLKDYITKCIAELPDEAVLDMEIFLCLDDQENITVGCSDAYNTKMRFGFRVMRK